MIYILQHRDQAMYYFGPGWGPWHDDSRHLLWDAAIAAREASEATYTSAWHAPREWRIVQSWH